MKNVFNKENVILSKLACSFPCYRLIPLNELRVCYSYSAVPKMKKYSLLYQGHQARMLEIQFSVNSQQSTVAKIKKARVLNSLIHQLTNSQISLSHCLIAQ
jgi:hypothetical protein